MERRHEKEFFFSNRLISAEYLIYNYDFSKLHYMHEAILSCLIDSLFDNASVEWKLFFRGTHKNTQEQDTNSRLLVHKCCQYKSWKQTGIHKNWYEMYTDIQVLCHSRLEFSRYNLAHVLVAA